MTGPQEPKCIHAFLWIYHADLDPSEVSRVLGLNPTQTIRENSPVGEWILSSRHQIQSEDPFKHIEWVLDQIGRRQKEFLQLLERGYSTRLYCKVYSHGAETYIALAPDIMKRMSDLGLVCFTAMSGVHLQSIGRFDVEREAISARWMGSSLHLVLILLGYSLGI